MGLNVLEWIWMNLKDVLIISVLSHNKKRWRMVINLCLGIYIAQAEDEEFSVVYAV